MLLTNSPVGGYLLSCEDKRVQVLKMYGSDIVSHQFTVITKVKPLEEEIATFAGGCGCLKSAQSYYKLTECARVPDMLPDGSKGDEGLAGLNEQLHAFHAIVAVLNLAMLVLPFLRSACKCKTGLQVSWFHESGGNIHLRLIDVPPSPPPQIFRWAAAATAAACTPKETVNSVACFMCWKRPDYRTKFALALWVGNTSSEARLKFPLVCDIFPVEWKSRHHSCGHKSEAHQNSRAICETRCACACRPWRIQNGNKQYSAAYTV